MHVQRSNVLLDSYLYLPPKSTYRKLFRLCDERMGELTDLPRLLLGFLSFALAGVLHSLKSRTLASTCNIK
jgi:hypothetical protein